MATPLFRQGASPNAKLFLYAVASVCVIAVDSRVRTLEPTRQVISTVLYPLQQLMLLPRAGLRCLWSPLLEQQMCIDSAEAESADRSAARATGPCVAAMGWQVAAPTIASPSRARITAAPSSSA